MIQGKGGSEREVLAYTCIFVPWIIQASMNTVDEQGVDCIVTLEGSVIQTILDWEGNDIERIQRPGFPQHTFSLHLLDYSSTHPPKYFFT